MSEHLVKMGTEAARAAQHQEAAGADLALSSEAHEKAGVDRTKGEALQEEADALLVKADEDKAMALSEEAVADGEAAKAAGEEEEAAIHSVEAASLQAAVDSDRAEAVIESAAASRAEFTAHGDELGTGLCEMVPVLDIVCDIIGGTAAVGLEATAAKDAAEAAALIAAAVEAEGKEKSEIALAVELQGEATKDGELAAGEHAAASELEAQAKAEAAEAQEEAAAAQEQLDQSVVEEEAAEEEEGEAAEEEAQSDASLAKSVQHGVAAFWDASCAAVISAVAVGFFAVRFTSILASSAMTHVSSIASSSGSRSVPLSQRLGQVSLHCLIFGVTLGFYGSTFFAYFDSLQIRARGGIVLLFALNVSIAQAILVRALPVLWLMSDGDFVKRTKACSLAFLESLVFLFPLVTLEFLILHVLFGGRLFAAGILDGLQQWYIWMILAVCLASYFWVSARPTILREDTKTIEIVSGGENPFLNPTKTSRYGAVTESSLGGTANLESAPLVSDATEQRETSTTCSPSRLRAIHRYIERYQLPFDLLIAACAFTILRVCLPNLRRLWPISKTIIQAAHPHIWIVATCGGALAVLVGVVGFCLYCRR